MLSHGKLSMNYIITVIIKIKYSTCLIEENQKNDYFCYPMFTCIMPNNFSLKQIVPNSTWEKNVLDTIIGGKLSRISGDPLEKETL